ncbi:MAG: BMP family ABC transporter substrate-binding protein [Bacillota bacterium]|jgi:basic membrane protein A
MKRFVSIAMLIVMAAIALMGCAPEAEPETPPTGGGSDLPGAGKKVILLVSGTLGDKSFFDSAQVGMERIRDELGCEVKTLEMGVDPAKWEPTLADVSGQDWDLIIAGTWQMVDNIAKVAPQFPDKKYVIFDTTLDYTKAPYENVYSITYKQNEGSYLAGALAALVTTSDMPKANPEKIIGFLGGQDQDVINDFLVGYIEGAKAVVPDIKVAISYVNSFTDPAKGKEMSLAQYDMGADIGFNVAGGSGLGQLDAAKEKDRYAIGVDSDQAMLFKDTDPEKANLTLTSMLKRIDNSLFRAVEMFLEGTCPFGSAENLGMEADAVGLSENEFYAANVPQEIKDKIVELKAKLMSGEIKVSTAFGMDKAVFEEMKNSVKP